MLHISQVPITVKLAAGVKDEQRSYEGRNKAPYDLADIPTDIPVQVIGWMEWGTSQKIPCWLLLGYTAVYPVAMTLVKPENWE